jgi:hypothetical protein
MRLARNYLLPLPPLPPICRFVFFRPGLYFSFGFSFGFFVMRTYYKSEQSKVVPSTLPMCLVCAHHRHNPKN